MCPACRLSQRLHVPRDVDYVQAFQNLNRVQLELRRHGPSVELLLRRCELERRVGNYAASHAAALDAYRLDPRNPEVHYQVGVALVYLAMRKAGAVPCTTSSIRVPDQDQDQLLERAVYAFRAVVQLNPDDQDAEVLQHELEDLAGQHVELQHVH